jgi:nucleoside diphosphate kinase
LLEHTIPFPAGSNVEKTLVLIKPDNFRFPNARPGGVIDLFSRTGLSIIGFKVHRMSVAQAEEFYGPVLPVLQEKLKDPSAARARLAIEQEFGFPLPKEAEKQLGEMLGPITGRDNWETIVQFMSGKRPDECTTERQRTEPGSEKCVAVVYQGVDAVRKIREVLGPTDPRKAPPGSIRKEFGETIMINAAHASDSRENAEREMKIIRIAENNFRSLIEDAYRG